MVSDSTWLPSAPVMTKSVASLPAAMVQWMSPPATDGRLSLSTMPLAAAVVLSLLTLTVKPTRLPAKTVAASAVLNTSTSGALIVMVALADLLVSPPAGLGAMTVAVLGSVPMKVLAPASAPSVGLVRCTAMLSPAVSVLIVKDSTWLPVLPVIWKSPGLPVVESMVQKTSPPVPAGSGSLRVTPLSVTAPMLVIVTVKPAVCPARIEAWSAVLVMVRLGWVASKKLSVLLAPLVVRTIMETAEGVPGGVLVMAPAVVEVWPTCVSPAGGVSVTV